MNTLKLKRLIRQLIKEQYDLSRSEKSVTHWLENNLPTIESKKIYFNKQQLLNFLESMKNQGVNVSQQYLDKMKVNILRQNSPNKVLQYLYDVYLKGSNLGMDKL